MILVSNERDLRALFERALRPDERLVVASGEQELRRALATPAAAVVIAVQPPDRIETWQRVRKLHSGIVVVAVDNQEQTRDWPPDVARRFLVRPFGVEEIVSMLAVRPRILREPAAARRRRLAKAQNPPVVPPPALPPPPDSTLEPLRRLETRESLWDTPEPPDQADAEPAADRPATAPAQRDRPGAATPERAAGTAAATPERAAAPSGPAPGSAVTTRERPGANGTVASPPARREPAARAAGRPDRRRAGVLLAAVALLLVATSLGGLAIGRATAPDRSGAAGGPASPAATPSTATPGGASNGKAPAACDAALSDADAAISYLVGNVRDDRLSNAIQHYQQNRRACRAQR